MSCLIPSQYFPMALVLPKGFISHKTVFANFYPPSSMVYPVVITSSEDSEESTRSYLSMCETGPPRLMDFMFRNEDFDNSESLKELYGLYHISMKANIILALKANTGIHTRFFII